MKTKPYTIDVAINSNGCPVVEPKPNSKATIKRHDATDDSPEQFVIEANRNGLLTLANWMIALADQESCLDHQHFDNQIDMGVFWSDNDSELIIQRTN
ncbi:Imm32 family immunity protein [Crateriforma conspicua]|uniref:Imm32 family immunity protein n=1 Tax=Crateriforma conspicua TaxID=2527996 RepID=UPI0011B3D33D|nr:hypothetical protein [Crateriforma conspicua]